MIKYVSFTDQNKPSPQKLGEALMFKQDEGQRAPMPQASPYSGPSPMDIYNMSKTMGPKNSFSQAFGFATSGGYGPFQSIPKRMGF